MALRAAKNVIGGADERTDSDELEAASMEVVHDMTFVPVHRGHMAGARRDVRERGLCASSHKMRRAHAQSRVHAARSPMDR